MRLTTIALGHLRRGKARAALVVAGLTLGVATAVALAKVTVALERHLGEELDRYGANIVVAPRTDDLDVSYGGVSVSGVSYEFERLKTEDLKAIRSIDYAERLAVVAPVLIGAVGGLVGWGAGLGAGSVAAHYFTEGAIVTVDVDPLLAVIAVAGAIAVGVLGALYPALKASKLDSTEALRYV